MAATMATTAAAPASAAKPWYKILYVQVLIAIVLGAIARFTGFSLWQLLKYLKDELWLVLGTSSSESALPGLMRKAWGVALGDIAETRDIRSP